MKILHELTLQARFLENLQYRNQILEAIYYKLSQTDYIIYVTKYFQYLQIQSRISQDLCIQILQSTITGKRDIKFTLESDAARNFGQES